MPSYDVKVGYPNTDARSRVTWRAGGRLLGHVREVVATRTTSRWFAEDANGAPLEGTFRTKRAAVDAVVEHAGA